MRILAALAACLVLVSCSSRQITATDIQGSEHAYQLRAFKLTSLVSWDLAGKLSIDDGQDGGSGRLNWEVREERSHMSFRGTLGKGSWQLTSGSGFAELEKSDGSITRAADVNDLIEQELGWFVPVDSLKWWALGVAAPGTPESMVLDGSGRILAMQQDGWDISYRRYRKFDGVELPARMDAVNGRYRLKIAVSDWKIQHAEVSDG